MSQSKAGQDADGHVSHVHFPPPQTMAGGGLEGVMIVVPALAVGQQGDPPEVRRGVAGLVGAVAPDVGG